MKRSAIFVCLVLLALGLLGASSAASRPLAGDLDPSFGSGGAVTHGLGSSDESPYIGGIVVQADGKIVVAGGSYPGDHGLLLARYLPDGSPDPSFGDGGYVESQTGDYAFAQEVALQPDGKIVVAGWSFQGDVNYDSVFTLARYNPDGSLDASFGTGGITNTPISEGLIGLPGSSAAADALAILPSGDILAGGWSEWGDPTGPSGSFVLTEYRSDGSLDPVFGEGGIVQTHFYGDDRLGGIAVQPDGKIVASGFGGLLGHGQDTETMALARYEPDGSLDPSFGKDGKVTTAPGRSYSGGASILQHGKIVVAGSAPPDGSLVLARYDANGRLDSSFGEHGFSVITRFKDSRLAVVAQSYGKILVTGLNSGQQGSGGVIRLRPDGRVDTSFGDRGIVQMAAEPRSLGLQTDGKILVGAGSGTSWTLSRLIGGNNCVVPSLRGKTLLKAAAALRKSYCSRGRTSKRFSRTITRGHVISTAPPAGARLPSGAKVELVVSKDKRP